MLMRGAKQQTHKVVPTMLGRNERPLKIWIFFTSLVRCEKIDLTKSC